MIHMKKRFISLLLTLGMALSVSTVVLAGPYDDYPPIALGIIITAENNR